ncbi:MAG TPA: NlpC/P60 family protein, partial [Candidatus Limnocylindria bacterium]|nr:NlpC/P60 family protein [Candidatus Limnocylindria bacterium]
QGSRTIEISAASPGSSASSSSTASLGAVVNPASVAVAADDRVAGVARGALPDALLVDTAALQVFADTDSGVSFTAPPGWVAGPASALNPVSDPPEPVHEIVRYQMRVTDPTLYAAPIPITRGLVADAGALITVGLARAGSGLIGMDVRKRADRELGSVPGFVTLDDEAIYEGVHVFSRYFFSRPGERVVVVRAAAAESDWNVLERKIMSTVESLRADPLGENAPAAPPPPPPPAPTVIEPSLDQTAQLRQHILSRAASLLGLRYVWGGNSTTAGMDCSAYVSWVWSASRFSTDSIWQVSFHISKNELRPGDALNLTTGRDPERRGHIRLFEAWANAERTLMWVYEETPPRVVHRVIVYDDRYQPIRLSGLSSAGDVKIIPGLPAPTARPRPVATRRPTVTVRPTIRPTVRPTIRATVRPTVRPTMTGTPRPLATATPRPSTAGTTSTATGTTPRPLPTPTRSP